MQYREIPSRAGGKYVFKKLRKVEIQTDMLVLDSSEHGEYSFRSYLVIALPKEVNPRV